MKREGSYVFNGLRRSVSSAALRVAAAFGGSYNISQPPPQWILSAFGLSGPSGPFMITERSALQLPVVWAAVRIIANSVAKCKPQVFRRSIDGDVVKAEPQHPVAMLLAEPNTLAGIGMPGLLKTSQIHFNINGNAYQQIERDENGTPVKLWPLIETTQPLLDADTMRGIVGYRTQIGGKSVDLPPGDVVHARDMSLDGWFADSPIRVCMKALQIGAQMEQFGLDFYLNDTTTGGILVHPGRLTDDAKRNIKKSWKDQARGEVAESSSILNTSRNEAFNIKVLEEGVKYIQTTTNPEQAQYITGREFFNSEVARIWNTPLVLLQSVEGSTVWGTGIEKLINEWVNQTIIPITDHWGDEYTRKLLTADERAEGLFIKLDVSELLRGDPLARAQMLDTRIKNDSLTVNEARRMDGLNPIEGGDEPYSAKQARLKPATQGTADNVN